MKTHSLFSKSVLKRFFIGAILEFSPVLLFLISFHFFHVYRATLVLMIATIISTVVTYKIQKRLPYLALYIAFLTTVFGYITVVLHEPKFIQMRDTFYDLTCATTLILGFVFKKPVLKLAFNSVISMTKEAWDRLTRLWIIFFVILAALNEYVRTTISLDGWFDFKSVVVVVTCLFGFITLYFVYEKADA